MASLLPASLQPGGATSTSLHRHTSRVTCHVSRVMCLMSRVPCHVSRGPPQTVLEDETPGRHGGQPQPRHQQAAQPEGGGDPGAVPEHGDMVQGIQELVVLTWCPCWGGVWGTEWTQQWTVDSKSSPSSCLALLGRSLHVTPSTHQSHCCWYLYGDSNTRIKICVDDILCL